MKRTCKNWFFYSMNISRQYHFTSLWQHGRPLNMRWQYWHYVVRSGCLERGMAAWGRLQRYFDNHINVQTLLCVSRPSSQLPNTHTHTYKGHVHQCFCSIFLPRVLQIHRSGQRWSGCGGEIVQLIGQTWCCTIKDLMQQRAFLRDVHRMGR